MRERRTNVLCPWMMSNAGEYLDKVRDGRQTQEGGGSEGDQAPEQRGLGSSSSGGDGDNGGDSGGNGGGSLFYLKDWHFQRKRKDGRGERTSNNTGGAGGGSGSAEAAETPFFGGGGSGSAEAAETPFFFADDWLNWWYVRTNECVTLEVK